MTRRPTSACSRGSGDSTSPLNDSASDASDRSSGSHPASESSNDIGRMFPDGAMSPSSALLPTPKQSNRNGRSAITKRLPSGAKRPSDLGLEQVVEVVQGILPKELLSMEELPGQHRLTSSSGDSPVSQSQPLAVAKPKTTTAGYGPTSPASFAILNPDGSFSKTSADSGVQESLEGLPSPKFSVTWPRWGSMHGGEVFEHPTPELAIDGNGSSSSLHTPTASDGGGPRYDRRASPGYTRKIPVPNLDAQVIECLSPGDDTPPPSPDRSR